MQHPPTREPRRLDFHCVQKKEGRHEEAPHRGGPTGLLRSLALGANAGAVTRFRSVRFPNGAVTSIASAGHRHVGFATPR